jgi:MSHA pilin protein MshA
MIKNQQRGFTLIELVVVIVILGILAAFAVPRFMGMQGDARAAVVKSMAGSLRSASTMGHAKCLAQACVNGDTISFEGTSVVITNSYPNSATVVNTIQGSVAGANGAPTTLNGWTVTYPTVTTVRFQNNGAGVNCYVQYANATNVNTAPVISFRGGVPGVNNATEQSVSNTLQNDCA